MADTKKCSVCLEVKLLGEFYKRKNSKDGHRNDCKKCNLEQKKKYRDENPNYIRAKKKKYRDENPDHVRDLKKESYKRIKVSKLRKDKIYRQEHKEELKEYHAIYRAKNSAKIALSQKKIRDAPARYDDFIGILPPSDFPRRYKGGDLLEVKCKKEGCEKYLQPSYGQARRRSNAFKGIISGESNYYCSDVCIATCPLYGHQPRFLDPRLPKHNEAKHARSCQTNHLKVLQVDEYGYNFCEQCGNEGKVDLHHTWPVAQYGNAAINSAGHELLCVTCHKKKHRDCSKF